MSEIQGLLVNFKVRVNGSGAAFKKMVCTEDTTFTITNGTATRKTNCGSKTSVSIAEFNGTGNAVFNYEPGATEVSWDEVKGWQKSRTKLDFTYENEADTGLLQGEAVSVVGSGYFTESAFTASAEDDGIGSFSWTFTGTGTLDSYDV